MDKLVQGDIVTVARGCPESKIFRERFGLVLQVATNQITVSIDDVTYFVSPKTGLVHGSNALVKPYRNELNKAPDEFLVHRKQRDVVRVGDVFRHKHRSDFYKVLTARHDGTMFFLELQEDAVRVPESSEHYRNCAPFRDVIEGRGWVYLPNAFWGVYGSIEEQAHDSSK